MLPKVSHSQPLPLTDAQSKAELISPVADIQLLNHFLE
jgi:hypothetical protein